MKGGYKVTGSNGNSIFLPAAFKDDGRPCGVYMSAEFLALSVEIYTLRFNSTDFDAEQLFPLGLYSVRPVIEDL